MTNKLNFPAVSGTLRSNLDPFGIHDDARLWDALKRAYLVEDKRDSLEHTDEDIKEGARSPVNRFSLDSLIEDEGSNLSIGQVCPAYLVTGREKVLMLCVLAIACVPRARIGQG